MRTIIYPPDILLAEADFKAIETRAFIPGPDPVLLKDSEYLWNESLCVKVSK